MFASHSVHENIFAEGQLVYNLITRRHDSMAFHDKRCILTSLVDVSFVGTC